LPRRERDQGEARRLFADELALLQPSPGYMRVLKESVRPIWKAWKAAEAFLFERSISIETYDRHIRTGATAPAFSYLRESGLEMKVWWTTFSSVRTR
jgi:hypothetical protein